MERKIKTDKNTKILVPTSSYNLKSDTRLLIPFISWGKIGFVNNDGDIVVEPKFDMYYGDCYNQNDLIKVSITETFGFPRNGGKVACYSRKLYGMINFKGEYVLDIVYDTICPANGNETLFTVYTREKGYAVIDLDGNEIIPYGKYSFIDGFDRGLARVKIGKVTNGSIYSDSQWGIIDISGKIVLPIEYDNIWNFYDKKYPTIIVIKKDKTDHIPISSILAKSEERIDVPCIDDNFNATPHFGEYASSYAQDVMGYSDEAISDAFDGDPEAYWNID